MPTLSINGKNIKSDLAIFDMDGTIIDLNHRFEAMGKVRAEIMKKTVGNYVTELWAKASGVDLHTNKVKMWFALNGAPRNEDIIVAATAIAINGSNWAEAKKLAEQIYMEADSVLAKTYEPILLPEIKKTLFTLKNAGIKLALATNAPKVSAIDLMESVGLKGIFDVIIGSDDVVNVKPAPDMILLACERGKCKPGNAIYIGDMPIDMIAGRNAKLSAVVAVKSEFFIESGYSDYDAFIDSYDNLKVEK